MLHLVSMSSSCSSQLSEIPLSSPILPHKTAGNKLPEMLPVTVAKHCDLKKETFNEVVQRVLLHLFC